MDIEIRGATPYDIKDIKKLLSFYYLDTESVEKNLPEFIVAVLDKRIAGCACLDIGDVVELRSIAVLPGYRNKGIGSRLVDSILNRAADLTGTVYLRTTSPGFFEKKGFHRLVNEEKKVTWKDCSECDKFNICKQIIMKI
ncbi:acetyltransferase, N-acetylglutamate synthase [Candidatus Methanoperedens nitroreducens]|uniref:Acetyltransferase, N-acetylglutamate synthase n=1 Tax=Candidatus Methanoperedens nitratireducens TaxID=1392998 RepID=A0A062VAM3_9EURY|nr:GNAT family N-acetyltransferase [Candidatus Methanoperedens nitroreducens]KCZ72375.1 acetyltransferase, N-acetylglutamate synthase [Candidatus Methanoperedens nitroreducens]MDJ1423691.1 GNAT family N-acetyltransferase [Candidatus Methanoperedens sp.]